MDAFPQPNTWHTMLPMFDLKRPLTVAMPCCGIDGCGTALRHMGISVEPRNLADVEPRYKNYLFNHYGETLGSEMHIGPDAGDITAMSLDTLCLPVDVICTGPPCPGWSQIGTGGGAR